MEEDQRKDMKKGKKKRAIQINYNLLYKIYIHRKPTEMKLTEEKLVTHTGTKAEQRKKPHCKQRD